MALTAQEITDIRDDIGDNGSSEAFSDDEINNAYDRASSDHTDNLMLRTQVILIRQLLASAAKMTAYKEGQTSVQADQVFAHLKDLLALKKEELSDAAGQAVIVALRSVPPKHRKEPG